MRFREALDVSQELRQIAADSATSLSRVATGDESWICDYDCEQSKNSHNEKVQTLRDLKRRHR
jgi:hypothetical protein